MSRPESLRLIPTGKCWCGCGRHVAIGAFFARGHDKVAEGALLAAKYGGSIARLLDEHGYGDTRSVTDDAVKHGDWQRCQQAGCSYVGTPISVARHLTTKHKGSPPA